MGENTRIEWIDNAKVIGIWLVILGHILNAGRPVEAELHTLVYSFHMPFFFFVSGILFSTKGMLFSKFLLAKLKSLIVPYILLNILCVLLNIPIYLNPDVFVTTNLSTPVHDFLTLVDGEFGSVFAPPSWFLITLFFVMIISFFVVKLKIYWQLLILCATITMSYVAIIYQFPLNIDTIPGGFVFFLIGYMLKGYVKDLSPRIWHWIALFLLIFATYVTLSLYNGPVAINNIIGKTTWLFWVVALFGIAALYLFSNIVSSLLHQEKLCNILRHISGGTIFILCIHETCIEYTIDFFLVNHSFHIPLVIREIILATAILIICIPFIYLIRRYAPVLMGNRK